MRKYMKDTVKIIDCTTMDKTNPENNFETEISRINREAEQAVREGYVHIILSDKEMSKTQNSSSYDISYKFCSSSFN